MTYHYNMGNETLVQESVLFALLSPCILAILSSHLPILQIACGFQDIDDTVLDVESHQIAQTASTCCFHLGSYRHHLQCDTEDTICIEEC